MNTVSHALHNKDDISAKTKEQIQSAAREMGYIRNISASSLRSGKTKSVAIIIGDISNPHFSILIKEIETLLRQEGYTSFILNTDENEEMEFMAITSAISKNVDGILLCPVQKTERNVRYLSEIGMPFALIGRRFERLPTHYVVCDDRNGGYQAASYLLSEGHSRILFMNGEPHISSARERLLGAERAYREAGISRDPAAGRHSSRRQRESGGDDSKAFGGKRGLFSRSLFQRHHCDAGLPCPRPAGKGYSRSGVGGGI